MLKSAGDGHGDEVRGVMIPPSTRVRWYVWYRKFGIVNAFLALAWTALMIIPFAPFSYALPIMEGGGPGQWLTVGYLLFISVGIGLFGWLSGAMHVIEVGEGRTLGNTLALTGLAFLFLGVDLSCMGLGLAGVLGGYQFSIGQASSDSLKQILSPFVYPISATVFVALAGSALTLLAMIRARGP
jgi:hypothetical protein